MITSGGVSVDQQGNSLTFGSNTAANAVNVKFGGLTATDGITTEAVLWTSGYNGGRTNIQFDNGVTASALTASGFGNVTLANAAATSAATANAIAGPVTIVGGSLTTTNEYNLGSGTAATTWSSTAASGRPMAAAPSPRTTSSWAPPAASSRSTPPPTLPPASATWAASPPASPPAP